MSANWNTPDVNSQYVDVVGNLKERDVDAARMFDDIQSSGVSLYTPSNIPDGTIRWSTLNQCWQRYASATSSWSTLASTYNINTTGTHTGAVVGNADTATILQTSRSISGTPFNGSANITISHTGLSSIGTNTHAAIDTALSRLANTSGTNTGDQTNISGNAATASYASNAGMLNGQSAGYYQPASTAITTSNIANQSVSYASAAGAANTAISASFLEGNHYHHFTTNVTNGTTYTYNTGYTILAAHISNNSSTNQAQCQIWWSGTTLYYKANSSIPVCVTYICY